MKTPLISFLVLMSFGVLGEFVLDSFIQLLLIYLVINMLLGMSLNLVNGYTGQFSLGHAGFLAIGAYTSAFASHHIPVPSGLLQLVYFTFLASLGGLAAVLAGWLVGQPSLRLKGDYLAIVTLGFGEIIRVIILNTDTVGGARGMGGIVGLHDVEVAGMTISSFLLSYSHGIFWLLTCFFVLWRLLHSAKGRPFLSVREDEVAASAIGIQTTKVKVRAFVISSFFAGVAGSIFAHYSSYINPSSFGFSRSVDAVIMVVLGGMGSMTGCLIAASIVTLLPELLRPLQQVTGFDLRMVIYSLSLVLIMIWRPQGLLGNLEFGDLVRRVIRKPKGFKEDAR